MSDSKGRHDGPKVGVRDAEVLRSIEAQQSALPGVKAASAVQQASNALRAAAVPIEVMETLTRGMPSKAALEQMAMVSAARGGIPQHVLDSLTTMQTVSDRIRALAAHAMPRSDIARVLGIRYQHVRNVLVQDEQKQRESDKAVTPESSVDTVKLGPNGRIVIPAAMREELGMKEGDPLHLKIENGVLTVKPYATVLRRVQDVVRRYVPEGVSLVDELIRERRREAGGEIDG
jgi:AbrB family looped-hinge helix DNA binding protein